VATIEMDLKDVLAKIDQRLDRMEQKLEALPRMEAEISQLKDDVRDIKRGANAQIWALIIAVIGAVIATVIKSSFFPNP
jgi:prefoldin subunit 5